MVESTCRYVNINFQNSSERTVLFLLFSYYLTAIPDFKEFIQLPKLRKLEPIEIPSDSSGFAPDFGCISGALWVHRLVHLPPTWEFGQGKNTTFYFTGSSRCFCLNKSVLETKETKQTDSQLCFAPKIIKIHLVVLENELIEVCMLIPKKYQKLSRVCHALLCVLLIKRTFTKVSIHIHA